MRASLAPQTLRKRTKFAAAAIRGRAPGADRDRVIRTRPCFAGRSISAEERQGFY